ncbi:MAG: hypothetical protein N2053_12480, partial [Chitinispirillaceae bacterium]|nr:hypothetical protein [Chitinispirillaceae bacterium]
VEHLMREIKLDPSSPLVGFDAVYFIRNFGTAWTETLLTKVKELNAGTLYFYINESVKEEELVWICKQNVPSFTELSTSRLAALISKSKFIVSGKSIIYALAGLLQRPAFGFFKKEEINRYCPQNKILFGVPFVSKPDNASIELMIEMIKNNS